MNCDEKLSDRLQKESKLKYDCNEDNYRFEYVYMNN